MIIVTASNEDSGEVVSSENGSAARNDLAAYLDRTAASEYANDVLAWFNGRPNDGRSTFKIHNGGTIDLWEHLPL